MRSFRQLSFKLTICYIIVIIMIIFGWSVAGTRFFAHRLITQKETTMYNHVKLISDNYLTGLYSTLSNSELSSELTLLSDYLETRILIVRKDGTLIFDTENSYLVNLFNFETDILSQTFTRNATLPGLIDKPFMSVSYPITYNRMPHGYLVLIYDMDLIYKEADSINTSYWPFVAFFCLLITIAFAFMYRYTISSLKAITKAATEYSNRNFTYSYKTKSSDEFKKLHDIIHCMATDINNLETYQKEFIANISHDFRSPLTSVRGYTEAMIDGTIPPELYEKYLNIILFETERLTKLTSNLLELNSFDNKGTRLDISSFDINKTIKQTAESFEGTCTKKLIRLQLLFDEPQTIVNADISKIQQVLYNLLDNAIKFSPQDSVIKISTQIKSDKVFVSVKDNGIGIPKESLSKIWERFYKTDLSRGKDKKGTGLGLSITREIINSHGENINVTSTVDVGTEFTFSLPRKPM